MVFSILLQKCDDNPPHIKKEESPVSVCSFYAMEEENELQ